MRLITGTVLRHRVVLLLFWLVLAAAGAATASSTTGRLTTSFALPGSASEHAAQTLAERYGTAAEDPAVLVLQAPGPLAAQAQRSTLLRLEATARQAGATVVAGPAGRDGRTATLLLLPRAASGPGSAAGSAGAAGAAGPSARAVAAAVGSAAGPQWRVQLTGTGALADAGAPTGAGVLAETLIGGAGALLVLLLVFASPVALLPLVTAAVSILTTFLLLLGLTAVTEVNFVAQFLIGLIGLGVAIDYSLLVVSRWREERSRGAGNRAAVLVANDVAGRAVALSGTTVTIGLLALVLLPMPAMRSFGYAGALIPLVSVAVAVTVVPVVLDLAGPQLDRFRLDRFGLDRFGLDRLRRRGRTAPTVAGQDAAAGWTRWARFVLAHRWWALAAGTVVLALLAVPGLDLRPGATPAAALASSGPARDALDTLRSQGVSAGVLSPTQVLVDVRTPAGPAAAGAVRRRLDDAGFDVLVGPQAPDGGTRLLVAVPDAESGTAAGQAAVRSIRAALAGDPAVLAVAGSGAGTVDFLSTVFGALPLLLTLVCLVTSVLLMRAFRSLLLAVKAVLLNLLSLGAAYGVLVLVWQRGHGSDLLWQTPATGAVAAWVPIMVFAFLFGLSMDYEVFLLARMREAHDRGAGTDAAVVEGLARTGRLVTSAALILFLAFVSMSAAPSTDVRVLATGMGAGILVDATVVRCLMVPALVGVLGRGNWWLPAVLARLLRVRRSPEPAPAVGRVPAHAAVD